MRRFSFLPFAFCFLLLTSCLGSLPSVPTAIGPTVTPNPNAPASLTPFSPPTDTPTPSETPTTTATVTDTPTFTLSPTVPTPTASAAVPPVYTLDVTLDYAAHTLSVSEAVLYQNSTGSPLTGLVLAVEPNLQEDCFVLDSLTVNGAAVDYTLNDDRLDVPLAAALAPGGTLSLMLQFRLTLPKADSLHLFGYNYRQVTLVDWYPFIVPYSGGWILHPQCVWGESLVYDEVDFDVTLHLADPSQPVVVAASAPAETVDGGWHFRLQSARTFVFSASPDYQTASTTVNDVTVTSYFFADEKTPNGAALDQTAKALATFSALFGPSPYASLNIVEALYFDAMEYDGLFFLSRDFYTAYDGTLLNNLVDLAVHETAHQWWFGSVGNDQALQPWLDEALATYSERLFYEENYPAVTAWQSFRIDTYKPTGWVDTDVYNAETFRSYANAVYLRGAQFLQALRERVGDEVFFAFLKDYAAQMASKIATSDDFFRILREYTSVDFSDLQQAYFQNRY